MEDFKGGLNNIGLKYLNLSEDKLLKTLDWSEKYGENGSLLISPSLPGLYILKILGYKEYSGEYLDFKDKEITDIGSGLGGFIFELENSAKKINAVDPLYYNEKREKILEIEINRGKKRVSENFNLFISSIEKIKKEINEKHWLMQKQPGNYQLYDEICALEEKIKIIEKNGLNSEKVLKDIEKRKKRGFKNSEKINLIGRSGEDTKLPNDSQDYVFITNVITKECVNPYKLLAEASRILKPGGKIIIVDEHEEVERFFKKIGKDFKMIGNHIRVLELEKEDCDIGEK